MNEPVEHSLNWCRLCRTCLTCPRNPRRVFSQDGCACEERLMRHHFKDVQGNGTTDFRFRHLTREENRGLVNLLNQMDSTAPDIEPNLVRANLCGTCQQRLRRAVEAAIEPPEAPSERTFDFRRRRSIRATISERNTNAAAANTMTSSGSTHRMSPVLEGAAEPQIIRHHTSAPMSLAPGTNQPGDTQQLQQRAPTGGGGVPSSMAAAAASAAQPSPQRFGDADNPLFEEPQRLGSIEFDSRASTSPRGFRGRR
ncbi:hypothetical protein GQ54DRAFT_295794 [Martensiomyces pterosporus]|nr:hypothetical protein GQ54DRAFT_295794 [Martensiomyces pterosporus]